MLVITKYLQHRTNEKHLSLPRPFEAGILLNVSELYRQTGSFDRARDLLREAIENYPGFEPLRQAAKKFDPKEPIQWRKIIFPESFMLDNEEQS